jgi:hypothetical protein
MKEPSEHGDPSGLRGWLSGAYFGALLSGAAEQLGRRLGARASIDDPLFGPASGEELPRYLEGVATWLLAAKASFDETAFTLGADRDVTEGVLEIERGGGRVAVPVGIVAVRRPAREIVIRTYFDAQRVGGTRAVRTPLLPEAGDMTVRPAVTAHLRAMDRGDVDGVVACFEVGGRVEDARGNAYIRDAESNTLRVYYTTMFRAAPHGITWHKGGRADDGRTCALEYTVDGAASVNADGNPGLAIYELGESGLLRSLRVYGDADRTVTA